MEVKNPNRFGREKMVDESYSSVSQLQVGKIQLLVITFSNDQSLSHLAKNNPTLNIVVVNDFREMADKPYDKHEWSKDARVRNRVLSALSLARFQYILWMDSDIVEYPEDLPTKLINANPYGISAPIVLESDPPHRYKFHNTEAFTKGGKNFNRDFPYFEGYKENKVIKVDSVACCYTIPANVYKSVSYEDSAAFSEHYGICAHVKDKGLPITISTGLKVYTKDAQGS